jgi:hypothetical protein
MPVPVLSDDDTRVEVLTFDDGATFNVSAEMRRNNAKGYADACKQAVRRKFATAVEKPGAMTWPKESKKK